MWEMRSFLLLKFMIVERCSGFLADPSDVTGFSFVHHVHAVPFESGKYFVFRVVIS